MVSRVSILFGTIVGVAATGWVPGFSLAQQGKPSIEQILQVWKGRQGKVASARFELSFEETIPKGSDKGSDSSKPEPPRDFLVKGTSSVSLSGAKLRYSFNDQEWDSIGKRLYPRHYVDVFDGRISKNLQAPASNDQEYAIAHIKKAETSESALGFSLRPLILTFRGSHPQYYRDLEKFKISGRTNTIAGQRCLELVRVPDFARGGDPSASSGRREVLYLDQDRDYVAVRYTIFTDDKPSWQLDVAYTSDAIVGWVPRSWEYLIRAVRAGQLLESQRITVDRYEINPAMDDKEFDISFPPKTRVIDYSTGTQVQYIIRENGEQGREIPGMVNPTYEDLQKAGVRVNRWVLMCVWAAIFVLGFGGWIWLRKRRMKRDPQQS
jgi:hypothetical protein